jgi:hypothetical protein
MDPTKERRTTDLQIWIMRESLFDGLLNLDVRPALQLEGTFGRVCGEIRTHRPFDIGRMGVVAFDEVGIVAIDRPEKRAQGLLSHGMKSTCGPCGFRDQAQS